MSDYIQKLKEHIALPNWEKRLVPLFLFKGTRVHSIRENWNIAYAMYLQECDSYSSAIKTFNSPKENSKGYVVYAGPPKEDAHLCGKHSSLTTNGLFGFFNRLRACPELTDSVSKAFTEYVEWINPRPFTLERVPLEIYYGNHRKDTAKWRVPVGYEEAKAKGLLTDRQLALAKPKVKVWKQREEFSSVYPLRGAEKTISPEQKLMMDVHAMIPKTVPHEIRGDLCQDLLVAVICGETSVENIPNVMHKYASKARKIMPDRWKHVSLDDFVPGTEGLKYKDTISDCEHHF